MTYCRGMFMGWHPYALRKVFWFAFDVFVFLLAFCCLEMKTLTDFSQVQNVKEVEQGNPNTKSENIFPIQNICSKRGAAQRTIQT